MTSYYTGTGDIMRSKLASTWESKPPPYPTAQSPGVLSYNFSEFQNFLFDTLGIWNSYQTEIPQRDDKSCILYIAYWSLAILEG